MTAYLTRYDASCYYLDDEEIVCGDNPKISENVEVLKDEVSADSSELNIMDGVVCTTEDINTYANKNSTVEALAYHYLNGPVTLGSGWDPRKFAFQHDCVVDTIHIINYQPTAVVLDISNADGEDMGSITLSSFGNDTLTPTENNIFEAGTFMEVAYASGTGLIGQMTVRYSLRDY